VVNKCVGKGTKFVLEQATKVQRGIEVYLYSFLNIGARRGWVVEATPQPIYPREKPRYPLYKCDGRFVKYLGSFQDSVYQEKCRIIQCNNII